MAVRANVDEIGQHLYHLLGPSCRGFFLAFDGGEGEQSVRVVTTLDATQLPDFLEEQARSLRNKGFHVVSKEFMVIREPS